MAFVVSFVFFAIIFDASAKPQETCATPVSLTPAHEQQSSEQSLLAFRSSSHTGTFSEEVTEHLAEYEAWSEQHQIALQKFTRSKTSLQESLDQMIAGQSKASSTCTPMFLDVGNTVSSLTHDLLSLSEQVSTHVRTLEVETRKLNGTVLAFENVAKEFSEQMSECHLEREQAAQKLSLYNSSLEVLQKIAKPSSPYTHTGKVEWPPVAPSVLEDGLWSKDRCLAFVNFTQQHQEHQEHLPQGINTDCDANRAELHKACSAMYMSIRGLAKEIEEQLGDKTCDRSVKKKKDEQLVSLLSQRKQQVSSIKYDSEKLGAIEPVLRHLNERVNDLDGNVQDATIKYPQCDLSDKIAVPEMVSSMHELIHSLQECPSHNTLPLDKLPVEEEPQHVAYTVCAGDGGCGTEEPISHNATSQMLNPSHVQAIMSWGGELE